MSKFLKVAEEIGEDISGGWFCCPMLPREERIFFTRWFEPTREELIAYNHIEGCWMSEEGAPFEADNNLRILALCLAHEIYKTEGGEQ